MIGGAVCEVGAMFRYVIVLISTSPPQSIDEFVAEAEGFITRYIIGQTASVPFCIGIACYLLAGLL